MNGQYMNEDFPPDADQVLFPLVSGAIYLKCAKARLLLRLAIIYKYISQVPQTAVQRIALYRNC